MRTTVAILLILVSCGGSPAATASSPDMDRPNRCTPRGYDVCGGYCVPAGSVCCDASGHYCPAGNFCVDQVDPASQTCIPLSDL